MSDTTIKTLASAVDAAVDALAQATEAYAGACSELNRQHVLDRGQPHPVLETPGAHVLAALSSRPMLARYLSLSPLNPGCTVAQRHPEVI
jgi:hypothetical protein